MRESLAAPTPTERFTSIVGDHLAPALEPYGLVRRRAVLEHDRGDLRWLIEVGLAPWTTPERIAFTLSWGVAVRGLHEVLDDPMGPPQRVAACPVKGRLRAGASDVEAHWFELGPARGPAALRRIADARTAAAVVAAATGTILPTLQHFDTVPVVQAHLVDGLVRGRGAPAAGELARIRWIAGLSILLGERANASRWLDYLEARSSATIAPDVVAERLADLRERCAS